jgi:hypothetical protein
VPPGNVSPQGPQEGTNAARQDQGGSGGEVPSQEQDPKRRIGDFEGTAEHSRQQPSALNDGQQHSR